MIMEEQKDTEQPKQGNPFSTERVKSFARFLLFVALFVLCLENITFFSGSLGEILGNLFFAALLWTLLGVFLWIVLKKLAKLFKLSSKQ
jgi:hypothetical protein